jgi:hypothetical protein
MRPEEKKEKKKGKKMKWRENGRDELSMSSKRKVGLAWGDQERDIVGIFSNRFRLQGIYFNLVQGGPNKKRWEFVGCAG